MTRGGGIYAEVSGDDRHLYFANRDFGASIRRVPVEGGEETDLVPGPIGYAFNWALSPDGIYYAQVRPREQGEDYSIQFLDCASGRTTELFRKEGSFFHRWLAVSPGEERILYGEQPVGQSELMLMENFR